MKESQILDLKDYIEELKNENDKEKQNLKVINKFFSKK